MGTPDFAVPSLQALLDHPQIEVIGVVTQPDRAAGRGRAVQVSPVKELALAHGLAVQQPQRLRDPEAFAALAALQPELIVVAAFGQILRPQVLELPRHGCLNVHASLLPRWRGAAPVAAALLAGDALTGSTIMRLDAGMDTGPLLAQAAEVIRTEDTAASLSARLARQGADLLAAILPCYLAGQLPARPQDHEQAALCRPLQKEQARIDWTLPAAQIERMTRAYDPWPGAFTFWAGQHLKIGAARVVAGEAAPGQVVAWEDRAAVGTGAGLLILDRLQLAGKRMLDSAEFLRGRPDFLAAHLSAPSPEG